MPGGAWCTCGRCRRFRSATTEERSRCSPRTTAWLWSHGPSTSNRSPKTPPRWPSWCTAPSARGWTAWRRTCGLARDGALMSHGVQGFRGTKRYVPRRLLGAGGMGAVYEVDDRATGARVALKMMLDDDAGRLLRFKQEFRVMAELHHPNLVRLFDLAQHEGGWFFTMELVHGQDLVEVLLHDDTDEGDETSTEPAIPAAIARTIADEHVSGEEAPASPPRRMACDPGALLPIVAQVLDALEFLH